MQFDIMQAGYDRAKTIFSPDGRLYQVEYAREAVNIGATSLGVVYSEGVILAARRGVSKLQVLNPEKIFMIDDHIGVATSGLISDGRFLVDSARLQCQRNRLLYDEPISLYKLAKYIADLKHAYTQYGGVRPFGVALLIGGFDDKPKLFHTDPAGILKEWKALAIGRGESKSNSVFEKEYKEGMKRNEALKLTIKALSAGEEKLRMDDLEVVEIPMGERFRVISKEELIKIGIKI